MVTHSANILIMAGGTGGHVFPALAVAQNLRGRGHQIYWLGTRQGLEADVIPREGFVIDYINIKGLRGKGAIGWLLAPARLLLAIMQALQICQRIKPHVVLGMGGFVTGPGGVASWLLRKPLIVHEQNAIPGLTNRLLAKFATRVLQAFPSSFAVTHQAITTGNPIRERITALPLPDQRYQTHQGAIRLLIIGGSLGAQVFNDIVPAALAQLEQTIRPVVRHQTGNNKQATTQQRYQELGVNAEVTAFITDMAEAYAWADLIICRAGAMTVSELSAVGLAAILVPFPFAVDDHQTANARLLATAGAAILLPQSQLTAESLAAQLRDLFVKGRTHLLTMAQAAHQLGKPDATAVVAQHCLEVMRD